MRHLRLNARLNAAFTLSVTIDNVGESHAPRLRLDNYGSFEKLNERGEELRDLMLEDINHYADPDKGETFRDLTPEHCQKTIQSIQTGDQHRTLG
jgi:hypothetical protein